MAGDFGYVPFSIGHYIENTGDERLHFLEVFNSLKMARDAERNCPVSKVLNAAITLGAKLV